MRGEKYLIKALYPVLGALPKRTQDMLEERYEGNYKKVYATLSSSLLEYVGGLALLVASGGTGALFYLASYLALEGAGRGSNICGAMDGRATGEIIVEADNIKAGQYEPKDDLFDDIDVDGSLLTVIPSKIVYWLYDKRNKI